MPNADPGFDFFHLLHLLLIPVVGVTVWLMKQLGLKADKTEIDRALTDMDDRFAKAMTAFQEERRAMHKENTDRLQDIQKTLLDIVGGRYGREDRR